MDPSFKEPSILQTLEGVQADHRALLGSVPCTTITTRVCEDRPKQGGEAGRRNMKALDSRHHSSNEYKIIMLRMMSLTYNNEYSCYKVMDLCFTVNVRKKQLQ